ncbi:acyl-CoA dehydrogenase family protein (plasmid) [Ralstonia pseudosolanacearum]|uniref:acyl-CoA dehydrogenase family protein n=1 Tax=Ralstonia pseudosolanacearum TaxID=1310165 RepID=UPI00186935F5|nr:acyl-CoA dehydrogenase family protein [Ralstonia pseudosolanacearum]QOK94919.1 acyl-CoA dehydrogenase family protein [Ralstonia pseudosolanacearum]
MVVSQKEDFLGWASDTLGRHGYFGLPIPSEYGGSGASVLECCAIQARLAQVDAGLAVGMNMHLFSTGVILEQWRAKQDLSWALLEAVATQKRLIASAFAHSVIHIFCLIFRRVVRNPLRQGIPGCRLTEGLGGRRQMPRS